MADESTQQRWAKLTAPLPPEALKPLSAEAAGGLTGMTDIHEWFLYERLRDSGLPWSETITKAELVSHVDSTFYYVAEVRLTIDGQHFDGIGAHDHKKLEWAVKGAHTSAFKDCCKWAGISMSVWKGGTNHSTAVADHREAQGPAARPAASPESDLGLCPRCGSPAKLVPAGTSKRTGKAYESFVGCTDSNCKWIRKDSEPAVRQSDPVAAGAVRNPSAAVVSPESHPSRNGGRDDDDGYWQAVLTDQPA